MRKVQVSNDVLADTGATLDNWAAGLPGCSVEPKVLVRGNQLVGRLAIISSLTPKRNVSVLHQ